MNFRNLAPSFLHSAALLLRPVTLHRTIGLTG